MIIYFSYKSSKANEKEYGPVCENWNVPKNNFSKRKLKQFLPGETNVLITIYLPNSASNDTYVLPRQS